MSNCPLYADYAREYHEPGSGGPLNLPFQRPIKACRTFTSAVIDRVIESIASRMANLDLARLFTNAFPNTLDTTIEATACIDDALNQTCVPLSFVVTGDIDSLWLRDSANQMMPYQPFLNQDLSLKRLFLGLIYLQAYYIRDVSPYVEAFNRPVDMDALSVGLAAPQPQPQQLLQKVPSLAADNKWELDSLASFLGLSYGYWKATGDKSFTRSGVWMDAVDSVLRTIQEQQQPMFDPATGAPLKPYYVWDHPYSVSPDETQFLKGVGNPARYTGMAKSMFRPSDGSCLFPFHVPANAMLSVELDHLAEFLLSDTDKAALARNLSSEIRNGIFRYAVKDHDAFGSVFAYEVDGYGSAVFMDDANVPSLLSLSMLGFVKQDDPVYQNTRNMVLSRAGNPYYFEGPRAGGIAGIGSPHVNLGYTWPLSLIVQIMTSSNDTEIRGLLDMLVRTTDNTGLIHESLNVYNDDREKYTRSWFAWANSMFGRAILKLANEKPHLIFNKT